MLCVVLNVNVDVIWVVVDVGMVLVFGFVMFSEVFIVFVVGVWYFKLFLVVGWEVDIVVLWVVLLCDVKMIVVGGVQFGDFVLLIYVGVVGVGIGLDFYCLGDMVD